MAFDVQAAAEPAQDPRETLCDKLLAKYNLELEPSKITYMGKDGIDYDGSVSWSGRNLTRIPVRFRSVTGDFYCNNNHLTTLEHAPARVGGYFSCYENHMTTLEHAPGHVGGCFYCNNNHLTTLAGAPAHVGGDFSCNNNRLTTLEHAPGHVGGGFYCSQNRLTSLEHAPGHVGGYFYCYHNHLPRGTKKPVGVKGRFYLGVQTPAPVHGAAEPTQSKLRDIDYVARMFEEDYGPGLLEAPEPWRVHPLRFGKTFAIDITNKETRQRLLFAHINDREDEPHARFQVWTNRNDNTATHYIDNERWRGHAVKLRVINIPNYHSSRKAYQTLVALAHAFLQLAPKLLSQERAEIDSKLTEAAAEPRVPALAPADAYSLLHTFIHVHGDKQVTLPCYKELRGHVRVSLQEATPGVVQIEVDHVGGKHLGRVVLSDIGRFLVQDTRHPMGTPTKDQDQLLEAVDVKGIIKNIVRFYT